MAQKMVAISGRSVLRVVNLVKLLISGLSYSNRHEFRFSGSSREVFAVG